MKNTPSMTWRRSIAALLICSSALIACTSGPVQPKRYNYSITMDSVNDAPVFKKPEVLVLGFAYGVANQFDILPTKWERENYPDCGTCGIIHQGIVAPRGDYLYFKWRVIATGEVFEDRVDLSKRLPQDMNDRRLFIAIFGSQLYVYLFPPQKVKQVTGPDVVISGLSPARIRGQSYQDTLRESAYARQHQIYP